ncbi:MAG: DUF599 domain-containing protein [Hyphomicrobiales bacterium]|nr:DUF599 domain-containing protein [Hyphomicrobiales bacterium]
MPFFSIVDLVALAAFAVAWGGYAWLIERSPMSHSGLNAVMNRYRETWMRRMLGREQRMVDMQIMAALHNGTAFFATTSLFAIGGTLTILRASDEMVAIASHLPFGIQASRALWEAKAIGLTVIFVYAFFKFAWSYRLYNYVAILLGAMPLPVDKETPEAEAHVLRTARLFTSAGRHFNRGQRAFFFALGYLGWFAGPIVLLMTTAIVVAVMWWRQYRSDSRHAVADGGGPGS